MIQNDYLNQSTGHPRAYSKRFDYPYLDAQFQPVDPRPLTLYDTISVTVEIDGAPIIVAHTAGPSDNVETLLVVLAQKLDALHPDVNAFSNLNVIVVQAREPTRAILRTVMKTPYRASPSPSVYLDPPGIPPTGVYRLNVAITRNGESRMFSVPANASPERSVAQLAAVVSSDPFLRAEMTASGGMVVATSSGLSLVSSAMYYG